MHISYLYIYWLVVSTPLKNTSQLGWLFHILWKIKHVPNHQPDQEVEIRHSFGRLGREENFPAWNLFRGTKYQGGLLQYMMCVSTVGIQSGKGCMTIERHITPELNLTTWISKFCWLMGSIHLNSFGCGPKWSINIYVYIYNI